jgi:thiamine-phosphate pyrophosphorylase
MISTLHYISQQSATASHLDNILVACEAGCRWIQLRVKNKSEADLLTIAQEAKIICAHYKATLIINDHPYIAKSVGAHGVHVGKEDMPVVAVRQLLGPDFIIGATANTLEDILQHVRDGADYVGVGPFRFTTTKEKLSPLLGLEGFIHIMQSLRSKGIPIPVIAIGGIQTADVPTLLRTGIHGIAVSGLITHAVNKKETVLSLTI